MDTQVKQGKEYVNNPPHYHSKCSDEEMKDIIKRIVDRGYIEAIDVIDAFTDDLTGMEAVCTGNALKYICRWKNKNGIEDIKKAIWYLNKLIEVKENE